MTISRVNAASLLAIDVGGVNTRAMLFDDVDGRYRFLGSGSAPTTANAPYKDVAEGVRHAIESLQEVTGRTLIGDDERLIIPSFPDGSGVDSVAATISAGPPIKVLVLGLLDDLSLESARNLARTTYSRVVDSIGLNDRRKPEARIDTILKLRPDLVLAAGGTEGGASQSVLKLLDAVGLSNYVLPETQRIEVLYVGNQVIKDEVKATLGKLGPLYFAPNVRPTLEIEQIEPAQARLAEITRLIRGRRMRGVPDLDSWAGGGLVPTATAFGRVIRLLNKIYHSDKGVLGIDIGSTATVVSIAQTDHSTQRVYPEFGLGRGLAEFLEHCKPDDIRRWLHVSIPESYLRDYLYTKALYPASIPATAEDLALEQALARQVISLAIKQTLEYEASRDGHSKSDRMPDFEPIVVSGSVITRAPNHGQSLLTLLDGLQPGGITTLVLDQHHLSPALGAASAINPVLTAQVLESSTFLNLGTVISPVGEARPGMPVLRIKMTDDKNNVSNVDIKEGSLETLQVAQGQRVQLHLQPLHRYDIGMGGPGRGGNLRVVGGVFGVIIDARGRPVRLPDDETKRRELIGKWRWTLGC